MQLILNIFWYIMWPANNINYATPVILFSAKNQNTYIQLLIEWVYSSPYNLNKLENAFPRLQKELHWGHENALKTKELVEEVVEKDSIQTNVSKFYGWHHGPIEKRENTLQNQLKSVIQPDFKYFSKIEQTFL